MQFPARNVLCILLALLVIATQARTQTFTFTTLAGGTAGTNDGVNGAAQFYFPAGIAVDKYGNLFVGDTSNNTIRKVAPIADDWVVTTISGVPGLGAPGGTNDGTMPKAQFDRPNGVVADSDGNLFIVDHNNDTIRQLTFDGTNWLATTIAGFPDGRGYADGTNSDARFWGPTGIAIDNAGTLYVGDTATFTVRKIARIGTNWVVTTIAGFGLDPGFVDGANSDARFSSPFGLAVDSNTNIYVADFGNHAIRKIRPIGTNWVVSTIAGSGNIGHTDGTNRQADFYFPADVALDKNGNLYVSDQSNDTIRKMTPFGTNWAVTTIGGVALGRGTNNGIGTNALFYKPWGITVDGQGRLFIVDHSNQTIREGVPASTTSPNLKIARSGPNVLLSWPLSASSFVLQSSSAPSQAASWTPLTNGVVTSGNYFWLTNNANNGRAFYRLHGLGP